MRGQLLVTINDLDQSPGDYLDIYINNVIRKRIYFSSTNLYSCPLYVGDVVRLEFVDVEPIVITYLDIVRRDFTTDDVEGNNGIVDTLIANGVPLTVYSFTATTVNTAYDFEYRLQNNLVTQYQIWTEASQPLLTEDNDYINQQY